MLTLVMVHGANATPDSWNYISAHLTGYKKIFIAYKSQAGYKPNLAAMVEQLKGKKDLVLIGHSLGGIFCAHLLEALGDAVKAVVTLSTPFGGSKTADLVKYALPDYRVMRDIGPSADPITEAQKVTITVPWTAIISTDGHIPMMPPDGPNDGIVTQRSMRARDDVQQIDMHVNHYEILMQDQTVAIIKQAIAEVSEVAA